MSEKQETGKTLDPLRRARVFVRVAAAAVWVQLQVWTRQLPDILDAIEARPKRQPAPGELECALAAAERIVRWRGFVIRKNCLKKNLLFYYLHATSGTRNLTLHVGVRPPEPNIRGHCWLTLNGEIYMDTPENVSQYTVMYSRGV